MKIFDDIYAWQGWGGQLRLGSGKCHLRIYDLTRSDNRKVINLRPIVVVVSDVPDSTMSVRSCCSHIASSVTQEHGIDPHRMLWVEYYPASHYGREGENVIPERFDAVTFEWSDSNAVNPKWQTLKSPVRDLVKQLVADGS